VKAYFCWLLWLLSVAFAIGFIDALLDGREIAAKTNAAGAIAFAVCSLLLYCSLPKSER
jgi:hypothetical protein